MGSLDVLYERIQLYLDIEDADIEAVTSFIFHGDKGPHEVKWGTDRNGKQRYRTINDAYNERRRGRYGDHVGLSTLLNFSEPHRLLNQVNESEDIDELQPNLTVNLEEGNWKADVDEKIEDKRTLLLDEIEEDVSRFKSIKTLRGLRRFEDREATQIIDERIREVEGETEKQFLDFQREIQTTATIEEARDVFNEAQASTNISKSNKELLGRLVELRFE